MKNLPKYIPRPKIWDKEGIWEIKYKSSGLSEQVKIIEVSGGKIPEGYYAAIYNNTYWYEEYFREGEWKYISK